MGDLGAFLYNAIGIFLGVCSGVLITILFSGWFKEWYEALGYIKTVNALGKENDMLRLSLEETLKENAMLKASNKLLTETIDLLKAQRDVLIEDSIKINKRIDALATEVGVLRHKLK